MLRACLLFILPLLGLAACSDTGTVFSWSSSGMSSASGGVEISGGGYRVDTQKPTIFYGTVVEKGLRRYTYLILARDLELPSREFEHQERGETRANGETLHSDHSLSVQGIELTARFEARISPERGVLEDPVLVLQGKAVELESAWLFLFDGRNAEAGLQPLVLEMPALPANLTDLAEFTEKWVDETVMFAPAVAELFGG